jgi:hypothetical protein
VTSGLPQAPQYSKPSALGAPQFGQSGICRV